MTPECPNGPQLECDPNVEKEEAEPSKPKMKTVFRLKPINKFESVVEKFVAEIKEEDNDDKNNRITIRKEEDSIPTTENPDYIYATIEEALAIEIKNVTCEIESFQSRGNCYVNNLEMISKLLKDVGLGGTLWIISSDDPFCSTIIETTLNRAKVTPDGIEIEIGEDSFKTSPELIFKDKDSAITELKKRIMSMAKKICKDLN